MSLEQNSVWKERHATVNIPIVSEPIEGVMLEIAKSRIAAIGSISRSQDHLDTLNVSMRTLASCISSHQDRLRPVQRKKLTTAITEVLLQTMMVAASQGLSNEDISVSLAREKQKLIAQELKIEKYRQTVQNYSHCVECNYEQLEDFQICPRCQGISVVCISRTKPNEQTEVVVCGGQPIMLRSNSEANQMHPLHLKCTVCDAIYDDLREFINHKHTHFSRKEIQHKRQRGPKIMFDPKQMRGLVDRQLPDCHYCHQRIDFPHFNKLTGPHSLSYHLNCAVTAGFDLAEAF